MKTVKGILKMQERIIDTLEPGKWKKIDDVRISLWVSPKNENFDRAWRELVICGKVELIGNEIRINQ
jgi:hypothetical protein